MCANLPPGVSWYDLEPKEHYAECDEWASNNLYHEDICICNEIRERRAWDEAERDAERMAEYATE